MANTIKINFDDVYDINTTSCEMRSASFDTELADGSKKKLMVAIRDQAHELMPNVYNLAFGPLNANGKIDDKAQIKHRDYSKAFSTILSHARTYLANNPVIIWELTVQTIHGPCCTIKLSWTISSI